MRYRITHTTKYAYSDPVAVCHNLVHLAPREDERQRCSNYRLIIQPEPSDITRRRDLFGNEVEYFSIQQAHRGLSLSAMSEVAITRPADPGSGEAWERVRDELPRVAPDKGLRPYQFAFRSPLIPLDPALADYATE